MTDSQQLERKTQKSLQFQKKIWLLGLLATLSIVLGVNAYFGLTLSQVSGLASMAYILLAIMIVIDLGRSMSKYYEEVSKHNAINGEGASIAPSSKMRFLYVGGTVVSIIIFTASILNLADTAITSQAKNNDKVLKAEATKDTLVSALTENTKFAGTTMEQAKADLKTEQKALADFLAQNATNSAGNDAGKTIGAAVARGGYYKKKYQAQIDLLKANISDAKKVVTGVRAYQGAKVAAKNADETYDEKLEEASANGTSILAGFTKTINSIIPEFLHLDVTELALFAILGVGLYILNEAFLVVSIMALVTINLKLAGMNVFDADMTMHEVALARQAAEKYSGFQGNFQNSAPQQSVDQAAASYDVAKRNLQKATIDSSGTGGTWAAYAEENYQTIKKMVENGQVNLTTTAIQKVVLNGKKRGVATANRYRDRMISEGVKG